MNLVGNAVKFTLQGEVSLSVFIPENQTGIIQFSVRDTGIGIPKDRHERLFKSFSQVDRSTSNSFGGTGPGLAISKTLCEKMGGRIWLESEAGQGSTFHFTLRLAPPDTVASERAFPSQEFSGKRVLVIEDKPMHLEMLKHRFQKLGMLPVMTVSAEEGIRTLRSGETVDAVVLSSRLLQLETAEVLKLVKQIRVEPSARTIPLLLVIPQHFKSQYAQVRDSGITSFLYEPIREAQFHEALGSAFKVVTASVTPISKPSESDNNIASRYPLRILVADDNSVNQLIARGFLRKFGYQIDMVTNGLEVIASLERQPYDLIFMDVQMPEMDGLEASRKIRIQYGNGGAPRIIAMTANAMLGDRETCLQSGMDDYISKPISLQAVRTALELWGKRIQDEKS
jgi:CheY-like chemotaxis protein